MFKHGFDAYMRYAYPDDELKPLSCVGRRWDSRERGTLDDSLGGYALTLIDSLSTLDSLCDSFNAACSASCMDNAKARFIMTSSSVSLSGGGVGALLSGFGGCEYCLKCSESTGSCV